MSYTIVDLSVWVDTSTVRPPSLPFPWTPEAKHKGPGFWQASSVQQSLHFGTHIDTPLHCIEDGTTTDDIDFDALCGNIAFFDLPVESNEAVTVEMLKAANPGLKKGDIVVLATGWTDKKWGQFPEYYTQSPYLDVAAAEWLREQQPMAIVFDFFEEYNARLPEFNSEEFIVHRILLGAGIYLIEQATNLASLKGHKARIVPAFYKIAGVEGAPTRLLALLEN